MIHWNLLYALKIRTCLNFIQNRRLYFLLSQVAFYPGQMSKIEDWGTLYTLYWGFKKIICKFWLLFNCFLVIKGILKAFLSFISWLLNFSDLPNYFDRNFDNFKQAVESPKRWNAMGYICLKSTFFHLKHYLQIYLTLLSTELWLGKLHEEYVKVSPGHLKVSKLGFW